MVVLVMVEEQKEAVDEVFVEEEELKEYVEGEVCRRLYMIDDDEGIIAVSNTDSERRVSRFFIVLTTDPFFFRYNLEYPHFYKKLYSLLTDATIFVAKYRARFFFLVDLFLTSTHIPAYLVCAFVKRLSRLALVAPPTGIIIILSLIRNLLLKHPNAQILVHW